MSKDAQLIDVDRNLGLVQETGNVNKKHGQTCGKLWDLWAPCVSQTRHVDLVRHVDWLKMKSPTTRFR
jgi:hypothetical protein